MRAAVLQAPEKVAFADVPRPERDTGEAVIRVTHSGICGTDLKIFQGGIPVQYPRIMGHESVGDVVEAGTGVKTGGPVIIDPVRVCGQCYVCQAQQSHLCPVGGLIGRDIDGGFADYVRAPAQNLYPLPDQVDPAVAPLIQPLTTCLHGVRRAQIFPGEAVVVLGLGVTGLMHVQLAKAHGAHPVIAITRSEWKRELAERLGADYSLPPDEHAVDRVLEITNGHGADLVIESAGKVSVLSLAVELARIGGRILPFGIYTEGEGALPFYQFYFKELAIINTRAAKAEDYTGSIDLVQRGIVDLKPLISHGFPLDEIGQALDLLDGSESGRMKIIFDHGSTTE